jgi:predicted permease
MSLLRSIASGLRSLFRKERVGRELDEELHGFQDMAVEEKIKQGMNRKEAARAVRLERGSVEGAKETVREAGWESFLESCWQDLRFGARGLRRSPSFTAVVVVTIALGIGATTSVFSLINAVLIRSLPYGDPTQLIYLWSPNPKFQLPLEYLTPMTADFFDLQRQNHSFASLSLVGVTKFNVAAEGLADALGGARVTGDFFETMGTAPELGRTLNAADDQPGRELVAVISHRFWRTRFGQDKNVLGRTLLLDSKPYRIIGVMPVGFGFPHASDVLDAAKTTDIWVPWAMTDKQKANRDDSDGTAIGRLRSGVSLQQTQAEMSGLMAAIDTLRPVSDRGFGARVTPFLDSATGGSRHVLMLLMGAVALLLIIACSNVAGLALARATSRIREMGVRTALGASRARLIRQLLTESLYLAIGGGALGVGFAFASIRLLLRLDPGNVPRLDETSVDLRVLLFALAVSLLSGFLFGMFPALSVSACDPAEVLTQSESRSVKGAQGRFRQGLIIAQISLTVVLLIGSGLFIRSLLMVDSVPKGFDPHSTVTMSLSLDARYDQPERQTTFYRSLIEALTALPGVQSVGAITNLPLAHGETLSWLTVEGHNFDDKIFFQTRSVTPRYFESMGIRLLHGRYFTDDDAQGRELVAIVNRTFARKYFPDQSALGKRFHFIDGAPKPTWWTIVGVVDDVRHASLEENPQLQAYLPFWQSSVPTASVVLRTAYNSGMIVAAVREVVSGLDSALAIGDVRSMDQLVAESTAARRFQTLLLAAFSAVALVLSLVGLYALVAYSVRQRTAEIGIRMALGAQQRDVLQLVIRQAAVLISVGVPLGLLVAWALSRFLASLLFEIKATDGITFAVVAFVVCGVAFVASYIPARRAMEVDPMVALRYE